MKLSMVHLQIEFCNVDYNFNQIKKSYIRSVLSGSELVVFPEFALTGYCVLSSDITIEVIGCNTQSLDEFHILLHDLVKQYCVPMVIGSFAYNNHTDSGTVSAYYYIDKDNFQLVKEKKQHKKKGPFWSEVFSEKILESYINRVVNYKYLFWRKIMNDNLGKFIFYNPKNSIFFKIMKKENMYI